MRQLILLLTLAAFADPACAEESAIMVPGDATTRFDFMPDQVFVERPEPLEKLNGFLRNALRGEAVVCLLEGEAGAGKTSLLKNFADQAQQQHANILVAYGSCNSFTGTGDAYLPFREILALLTGDVAQGLAEGRTNQENVSRLTRFVRMSGRALVENGPDLVDIFVPGGALLARLGGKAAQKFTWVELLTSKISRPSTPGTEALTQANVFEQYTQVLEAMSSECPLILILDDLHWADQASLGLLFHLSRRLINDPVLIVGAYRKEELVRASENGNVLKRIMGELKRIHGDIDIDLDEMRSRDWLDAFIATRKNRLDQDFRDALSHHTACNPLFAGELLRHLQETEIIITDSEGYLTLAGPVNWESLPSRITGVIEARVGNLSEFQRDLLNIACVQGEEFFAEPIASIMDEKPLRVMKELSGGLQRDQRVTKAIGVQEIGSHRLSAYSFRHNLFQHYLYQQLDEIERTVLHTEVGRALENLVAGDEQSLALTLARHFSEARQWQSAMKYSVLAADRAAQATAPDEAILLYDGALSLAQTHDLSGSGDIDVPSVKEKLADQYQLAARHKEAIAAYEETLAMVGDALVEARLLRKLSLPYQRTNAYDESLNILGRAERTLETDASMETQTYWQEWIEIQIQRGWIFYWRNQADELDKLHEQLQPVVEKWGAGTQEIKLKHSRIRLGLRRSNFRSDQALIEIARSTYGNCMSEVSDALRAHNAFILGFVLLWADQFAEAAEALEESRQFCRRCGDVVLRNRTVTWLALAKRQLLATDEVTELLPECFELSEYTGANDYLGLAWSQRAWIAWRKGDSRAAEDAVDQALAIWREKTPTFPVQWPGLWVAFALAAQQGNWPRAIECIEKMNRPLLARQPAPIHAQFEKTLAAVGNDLGLPKQIVSTLELAKKYAFL